MIQSPKLYTVKELLDLCGITYDPAKVILIGGLTVKSEDQLIRVTAGTKELAVMVDDDVTTHEVEAVEDYEISDEAKKNIEADGKAQSEKIEARKKTKEAEKDK